MVTLIKQTKKQTLQNSIGEEKIPSAHLLRGKIYIDRRHGTNKPRATRLERLRKFFWNLSWEVGQITNKLPVSTGNEEYEYNVNQKE